MAGFGLPEYLVVSFTAFLVYGTFMTVDAIRRPANRYQTGHKGVWVTILILTNPLINIGRFFGSSYAFFGVVVFIVATVAYHIGIRLGKFKDELAAEPNAEDTHEKRMG